MISNEFKELENLSSEEKELALKILSEYSNTGNSETYTELLVSDYEEVPVDIITFIKDDRYLGRAWHLSDGTCKLYPYWEKKLKELFPDNISTSVNNFILSGARGLGKSEMAITIMAYLMYRVMCLKNPLEHFNLKPTETIAFPFMNITEALAIDIGVSKFQKTVQLSPWFMARGTLSGKKEKIWEPPSYINIIIGSQPRHVIGQACLSGDTPILTSEGVFPISELENKDIKVFNMNNEGKIVLSDWCTVACTSSSNVQYELELEDGTKIHCTPNHLFLTTKGKYIRADELTIEDDIMEGLPYGYVYKTTNTINGKVYIGQHRKTYFEGNKYLGSGFVLDRAIQKYGKDKFKVELLEFCDTKKKLDEKEKYYIKHFNTTNISKGYNIACGGQGGDLGPEVRKKISEKLKGHPCANKGKLPYMDENGKIHYLAKDEKVPDTWINRNNARGHIRITNGVEDKLVAPNSDIPAGFYRGCKIKGKIKRSEAFRKRISEFQRSLDRTNMESSIKGKKVITDGKEIRFVSVDDTLQEGWEYGNCKTAGKHDMSNYYSSKEQQLRNSIAKSGSNNSMYNNGYRVAGGNNGKATIRYFFKDKIFECRIDLVNYLNSIGIPISHNAICNIINKTFGKRTEKKFQVVIDNLRWEYKHENN